MKIVELTDPAAQFSRQMMEKYADNGLLKFQIRMDTRHEQPIAELSDVWIDKKAQGTGVGTQVMRDLTTWADRNNILVYLSVAEKDPKRGTTSSARLKKFYKRFGFVENKGRNKRFDLSMYANMYREPKMSEALYEGAPEDIEIIKFSHYIFNLIEDNIQRFDWKKGGLVGTLRDVFSRANINSRSDLLVEPPPWVSMDDLEDLEDLSIAFLPEKEEEGMIRRGGLGFFKSTGKLVIIIYSLHPSEPEKYLPHRLSQSRTTFIHEFVHFLDRFRGSTEVTMGRADAGDFAGYFLTPSEFNAYYQEAVGQLWSMLNPAFVGEKAKERIRSKYLDHGFGNFMQLFLKTVPDYYNAPFTKYRNKIRKRLYKLYTELVSRLRAPEVTEGHDNSFYLHPDIEPKHNYPLPQDAQTFEPIASPRRGSNKIRVRNLGEDPPEQVDVTELFNRTATAQQGEPEQAMLRLQFAIGGSSVMSFVAEHIGDLTHRMSDNFDKLRGSYYVVKDKVEKSLRILESGYGFEREFQENLHNNFNFLRANSKVPDDMTKEQYVNRVNKMLNSYADAHKKVPVFNEAQWHAREAAVSLGNQDFDETRYHLKWLFELLQDRENYIQTVSTVEKKRWL